MLKRILSIFVCFVILTALVPQVSFANEKDDITQEVLSIEAQYSDTVKIQKSAGAEEDFDGVLRLSGGNCSVERNYSQKCVVGVENTSNKAIKYYLKCVNVYDDIAVNFVKEGSSDNPAVIQPGETQSIELSIFTQNAEEEDYELPIYAYAVELSEETDQTDNKWDSDEADAKTTVFLKCSQSSWNISLNMTAMDESTLSKTYLLVNNGEDITDIYVYTEGEIEEYIKYYPIISNYQLKRKESVSFTLLPDLTKMKKNSKSKISGNLIIKSGVNKLTQPIEFDTDGSEITTTTMGELGLIQDGNPYYNLTLNEESVKSSIKLGEEDITFDEIIGDKKLDEVTSNDINSIADQIFNESTDYCFDISEISDFTYGSQGETISISTRVYVTAEEEESVESASDDNWYTFDPATGTLTVTDTKKYNSKEYEQLAAEIMASVGKGIDIPGTISKIIIPDDHTDFQVHVEKKFIKEAWKTTTQDVEFIQDINSLNKGLKVYSSLSDAVKVGSVIENPNYDNATKIGYTGLKAAKNVLRWASVPLSAHPVGFIAAMIGEYCIDQMIGDLEDAMTLKDGSAMYYDVYGSQCTNRGSVTADFYVPNFKRNDIELYETGRMYDGVPFSPGYYDENFGGNNYVHNYDTKYDYYLNDEKIGTSENNGLTEVNMLKLPAHNLKFGQSNRLQCIYNTNQGHYLVTTDSEITLIYPNEAEISYIGTPDGLEDVRLHPDFAVYSENVYAGDDLIVGEQNSLRFNIYNRGSQSGWVTIYINEDGSEIYRQDNIFVEAFSSSTINLDWTPLSEKNNIEIKLENATFGNDERKQDNNVARKTIIAGTRKAPEIANVEPRESLIEDDICLSADIVNAEHIKDVWFYVDGVKCGNTVQAKQNDDGSVQYYTIIPPLSAGKHALKVETEYYTNKTNTALTEKTGEINVSDKNVIGFSVDSTVVNPRFTVVEFRNNRYEATNVDVTAAEDGAYSLKLTNNMMNSIADYSLLMICESGFVNMPISELYSERKILSLNNCRNLELNLLPEKGEIESISVSSINDTGLYTEINVSGTNIFKFSPSKYNIEVRLVNAEESLYLYNIDLSEQDNSVDLSNYIIKYEFDLSDEDLTSNSYINAYICYNDKNGTGICSYLNTNLDLETKSISCTLISQWETASIEESDKAYLYLNTKDSLYKINIKSTEIPVALSKKDLIKVGFKMSDESKLELITVSTINSDKISCNFSAGAVYLSKDIYDIYVTYKNNTTQFSVKENIDLREIDEKTDVMLKAASEEFVGIKLELPKIFEKVSMNNRSDYDVGNYQFAAVPENNEVMLLEGKYKIEFLFANSNYESSAIVQSSIDVRKDIENTISVGSNFYGEIGYFMSEGYKEYSGGKEFSLSLRDLNDSNNNILESYYTTDTNSYLVGTATFTSIGNPEEVYKVLVSGDSLHSISGILPNVNGEFNVSVNLQTSGIATEGLYINAVAGEGGSISPSGIIDVGEGDNLTFKVIPSSGYKILDVIVDDESVGAVKSYTFENITKAHTIIAKFEKNLFSGVSIGTPNSGLSTETQPIASPLPSGTVNPSEPQETSNANAENKLPFTDVTSDDWFFGAVADLYNSGIIKGVSDTMFSPYEDTTRAEVITMLYRMSGDSMTSGASVFSDIGPGDWYSDAIVWGINNKIVNGNGDGSFAPNRAVTREELVKMIIAYARYTNSENITAGDISGFADADRVSSWALESMQAAYGSGIINGYPEDNTIRPQGTATRAELAQLISNYKI